jgi:hypothetical protein
LLLGNRMTTRRISVGQTSSSIAWRFCSRLVTSASVVGLSIVSLGGLSFARTDVSTAVRARALEVLFRAGCVAPDPSVLESAEAIMALAERSGSDGVRKALGCAGPDRDETGVRSATGSRTAVQSRAARERDSDDGFFLASDDGEDDGDPATPTPTPSPGDKEAGTEVTPAPASASPADALWGTSVKTDYTAKHFSLIAGAAVLNRFQLSPTPVATPGDPVTSYTLDGGSTVARAFLEGNVRYRWAWLDRLSLQQTAVAGALETVGVQEASARRDAAARVYRAAVDADAVASKAETRAAVKRAAMEKEKAETEYAEALRAAYEGAARANIKIWQETNGEVPATGMLACMRSGGWFTNAQCIGSQFIPQDWEARLGYVFDSGSSSSTAGIPAASDLYGRLSVGWNLVRWSFPTSNWAETPLRGSINFEPSIAMVSDSSFNDVHEQYFIGASSVIGVPIRWTSSPKPKTIGQVAALENAGAEALPPDPVVEFLARIGASHVDVPVFLDQGTDEAATSKLIRIRHGQPDFRGEWGLGVDFELNVPVPNNLGYVIARGMFNAELDPDPWALQLGYTIPISNLIAGLGASSQ